MKTISSAYIDKEEATQRKPVEIYHIWRDGGVHWRYTDGDVPITYDSNLYSPVAISRSSVNYNAKLDITTLKISAPSLQDPVVDYLSVNPVEILWISVMKLHRDQDPFEADVVFIGQIKEVSFKGIQGSINCVGFEHFLKSTIPVDRYQKNCNHIVFDDGCKLVAADYLLSVVVGVSTNGIILTATEFGAAGDGYYIGGKVNAGPESRTIVNHVGNEITLMYKMLDLESGDLVEVYPGCDGRGVTCRDKYNNILNFFAMEFIPVENPATRIP